MWTFRIEMMFSADSTSFWCRYFQTLNGTVEFSILSYNLVSFFLYISNHSVSHSNIGLFLLLLYDISSCAVWSELNATEHLNYHISKIVLLFDFHFLKLSAFLYHYVSGTAIKNHVIMLKKVYNDNFPLGIVKTFTFILIIVSFYVTYFHVVFVLLSLLPPPSFHLPDWQHQMFRVELSIKILRIYLIYLSSQVTPEHNTSIIWHTPIYIFNLIFEYLDSVFLWEKIE